MSNMLSYEIKEQMRENAYSLIEVLIQQNQPFRIVMWNNNDWDMDLPESIMESFKTQLVLDIKDMALEGSYIDDATGEVILCTVFDSTNYSKVLKYDEIIGIFDLKGQPYQLNSFNQEPSETDPLKEFKDTFIPKTKAGLIELAVSDGIPKEAAERSINAFMKNNPALKQKFK